MLDMPVPVIPSVRQLAIFWVTSFLWHWSRLTSAIPTCAALLPLKAWSRLRVNLLSSRIPWNFGHPRKFYFNFFVAGFMFFWGIVFFVTTTVVMIFKKEKPDSSLKHDETDLGIFGTYKLLKDIIFLPVVLTYVFNSLTSKVRTTVLSWPSCME